MVADVEKMIQKQDVNQMNLIEQKLYQFEKSIEQKFLQQQQLLNDNFISSAGPLRDEDEYQYIMDNTKESDSILHEKFEKLHNDQRVAQENTKTYLENIVHEIKTLKEENLQLKKEATSNKLTADEYKRQQELERLAKLAEYHLKHEKKYAPYDNLPFLQSRYPHTSRELKSYETQIKSFITTANNDAYQQLSKDMNHMGANKHYQRVIDDMDYIMHAYYKPSDKLKTKLASIEELEARIATRKNSNHSLINQTKRRKLRTIIIKYVLLMIILLLLLLLMHLKVL